MTIEERIKNIETKISTRVQRGTASATVAGVTVTINAVNMSTTSVRCSSGRAANDNIVLTNATTITVSSSVAGNVNWEVIDYGG